jgi:hypothetical protein
MRIVFGAVFCFAVAFAASSTAQAQNVRVRGTVAQLDGAMLTVKSRDGELVKLKLADDIRIVAMVPASLTDIKPNSFVGATAMPDANGHWQAVEVHIFPEAQRGTGEGDRAFDYRPKSTMTNGTVGAVAVGKPNGATLTLNYKEGEKQVEVTPQTVIYTYAPGTVSELKPGAIVFVSAAIRQTDGTLMTGRVNVGRGVAPPI